MGLYTYNAITAKTAKGKATLCNSYFSSVFHLPSTRSAPSDHPDPLESEGQISEITLDVIDEVSQRLRYLYNWPGRYPISTSASM